MKKLPIRETKDAFAFGATSLPKKTPTAFRKSGRSADFYLLDALMLVVNNPSMQVKEYLRTARENGIQPVSVLDKKEVLNYLTGKTSQSDRIDASAARNRGPGAARTKKRAHAADGASAGRKKRGAKRGDRSSGGADRVGGGLEPPPGGSTRAASSPQRGGDPAAAPTFAHIVGSEVVFQNRASTLNANARSFASVLKILEDATGATTSVTERRGGSASGNVRGLRMRSSVQPIIIIPAAVTSLLTLYNVKDFLERGTFVPSGSKRQSRRRKPPHVLVTHNHGGQGEITYRIVESATQLEERHWERVVAVFAHGPSWQFKGWKWRSPVEIFSHAQGFHLRYDDNKQVDANVKKWAVEILHVNQQYRHLDIVAVKHFWSVLERFMRLKKRALLI